MASFIANYSSDGFSRVQRWVFLARDCQYNVKLMAKTCNASARKMERYFQQSFGRTPQDWLDEQRMIVAQILLLEGNTPKWVRMHLGFKDDSTFYRQFKRHFAMTPLELVELIQRRNSAFCRY